MLSKDALIGGHQPEQPVFANPGNAAVPVEPLAKKRMGSLLDRVHLKVDVQAGGIAADGRGAGRRRKAHPEAQVLRIAEGAPRFLNENPSRA